MALHEVHWNPHTRAMPEAPLPTWDAAVAHAETLRAQGVDVGIDERYRVIEIRGTNGLLHDPADGTAARQGFYSDGTPKRISHHTNGWRRDPDDGTPALQWFYSDGTPKWISHYTDGKLVSEESFPPPTGET
jgi:hypothetical protein